MKGFSICTFGIMVNENKFLTKRLKLIRNAWHLWLNSALVFAAQRFR